MFRGTRIVGGMGRRAMYDGDQIGPFDGHYHLFNEDLNWSIRAHRRGLVFHYSPNLPAVHYSGLGRAQNKFKIPIELYQANLYLYARFFGRPLARVIYLLQSWELLGYRLALEARQFMRDLG